MATPPAKLGLRLPELPAWARNEFETPALRTAIVFVHGYLAPVPEAYWLGSVKLMHDLRRRGIELEVVRAPVTGSIAERAQRTAAALEASRAERIVVVGHSMGGLDARFAIRHHDPGHRVTDLITLGTPHRGTMIADLFHRLQPRLPTALRRLDRGGLEDLTRAAARRFNELVPDRDGVRYHAICGRVPPSAVPLPIRSFSRRLQSHEGDNDSLVSVRSARWGETTVVDDADHWSLIGLEWMSGTDLRHRLEQLGSGQRPLARLRLQLKAILKREPSAG